MAKKPKQSKKRKDAQIGAGALRVVKHFFPQVTRVNDSHENVRVEVLPRDVNSSKVRNHGHCAMAVACKRTFKVDGVIISVNRAYLIKGDEATRYTLPPSVSREIVSFDREAGFDEGIYQLNKISKSAELGANRNPNQLGEATGTGPSKVKQFKHFTRGVRPVLGSKVDPLGITKGSLAPR